MATVTGYTAERMKEIEDAAIIGGSIDGNGDLILETFDGTFINAGSVIGVSLAGYVEPIDDRGDVAGTVILNFATHNVWRINPTAAVTLEFANLPDAGEIASGTIIVDNSSFAITWEAGTKFDSGAVPTLDGETWLTLVARSTHVTVVSNL